MKSCDGDRYVGFAYNEYEGIFLIAPQYPNAAYTRDRAFQALQDIARKNNCVLGHHQKEFAEDEKLPII
jgi:hypothetical protein